MRGGGRIDSEGRGLQGPCPHAYGIPSLAERERPGQKIEGPQFPEAAAGVPGAEKEILGPPFLGDRIRLLEHREHNGRNGERLFGTSQKARRWHKLEVHH